VLVRFTETQDLKVAEVVEVMEAKKATRNITLCSENSSAPMPESELSEKAVLKYYIHFLGENRRLDRWVKREELEFDEE